MLPLLFMSASSSPTLALAPAPILILGWSWWTMAALPFAASHLIGIGDRLVSNDDDQ